MSREDRRCWRAWLQAIDRLGIPRYRHTPTAVLLARVCEKKRQDPLSIDIPWHLF